MNITIFKTLLIIIITALLIACYELPFGEKGDKHLWLNGYSNYFDPEPSWGNSTVDATKYFGQYNGFGDLFQSYNGEPHGPIAAVWRVTTFPGEKPGLRDCEAIKPKSGVEIGKKYGYDSPELKFSRENYERLYGEYSKCGRENYALKQEAKSYTYYYARSTDQYIPILPPRPTNHALYETSLSFSPMADVRLSGLTEELKAKKDQLEQHPCMRFPDSETCYRLPGNDSSLYYAVRSILAKPKADNGAASSAWQVPDSVREVPLQWHEIKGITISKEQYEYLNERCKGSPFDCRLDSAMPNLTPEQKQYSKATEWDIDTDEKALAALIKKAKNYRRK